MVFIQWSSRAQLHLPVQQTWFGCQWKIMDSLWHSQFCCLQLRSISWKLALQIFLGEPGGSPPVSDAQRSSRWRRGSRLLCRLWGLDSVQMTPPPYFNKFPTTVQVPASLWETYNTKLYSWDGRALLAVHCNTLPLSPLLVPVHPHMRDSAISFDTGTRTFD